MAEVPGLDSRRCPCPPLAALHLLLLRPRLPATAPADWLLLMAPCQAVSVHMVHLSEALRARGAVPWVYCAAARAARAALLRCLGRLLGTSLQRAPRAALPLARHMLRHTEGALQAGAAAVDILSSGAWPLPRGVGGGTGPAGGG